MSKDKTKSRITEIHSNLQQMDSNDLLSIWEGNDREEWTDEAFDAIREILLDRLGSLPNQKEKIADPPQLVAKALQYLDQADAFAIAGEMDKALQACEAAVRTTPHSSPVHNHLGRLLLRAGRVEAAIGEFKESIRLDPKNSDAERNFRKALRQSTKPQRIERRKQAIRSMWRDGLSFGLIWVVFELIIKMFPYRLMNPIAPIYIESALYALAGASSAADLGYRICPHRKVVLFAIGGALACAAGYMGGVIPGYQLFRSGPDHIPYAAKLFLPGFPITLAFLLMGACLGIALGIIEKDWMRLKWLTFAGAVGFSFYFLITFLYSHFVIRHLPLSLLVEDPSLSHGSSGMVLVEPPIIKATIFLVRGIISGVVSGALLGFVLRQPRR